MEKTMRLVLEQKIKEEYKAKMAAQTKAIEGL